MCESCSGICVNMSQSKRKATSAQGPPSKRKATGQAQATLHNYFKATGTSGSIGASGSSGASGASGSSTSRPLTTTIPEDFGIHIYSTREIEGQTGLTKEYRKFWNVKAKEFCQDKRITSKMDGTAIKGAINTSWTLHKSNLLMHQAAEIENQATAVWTNPASREHNLKGIQHNKERVKTADAHLQLLYHERSQLTSREECKTKEKEMEMAMTELKKAQDSLNKALKNRERDVKAGFRAEEAQPLKVADVPQLSSEELEGLVEAVKIDQLTQAYHADPDSD